MTLFSLADRAPDAALVAGLAVNDDAAAAAFVRRFEGRVFGLALAITRDRGLAEEVSQEAFLRAWRAAEVYDQRRASVLTWLLTITRNAAIDTVRARRSTPIEPEVLERLIGATLSGTPDAPTDRAEHLDAAERLRDLPPEQARAVVLAVIVGHTAQQVADLEGIPLGTAKTRIRTGLRRMRATVVAQDFEVDDD